MKPIDKVKYLKRTIGNIGEAKCPKSKSITP